MRISDWRKEEETAATAAAAAAVSVATPHLGEGDTTPSEPTPHVAEAATAEVIPAAAAAAAAAAAGQGETPLQTTTAGQEGPPPPGQEDLELAPAVVKPNSSPKEGDAEAKAKENLKKIYSALSEEDSALTRKQCEDEFKQLAVLTHEGCYGHGAIPGEDDVDDPGLRYKLMQHTVENPHRLEVLCAPVPSGCLRAN
jgi:hypothetical protein